MNKNSELSKDSERRKLQEDIERLQNVIGDDDFNSDEDSDNDNLQIDITTEHGEGNEDVSSRIPSQAGSINLEAVTIDDRDTEEIVINLNENVPIDPDTCLALNKAYQEVLLDMLRSIEMALIENRDKQNQLQECLDDPKKEKTGEGGSRRTISSYHKPFFTDASGDNPPTNLDVQLKKRTGELDQNQKPQNPWRNQMKTDLKEAVYLDSLCQQTRHLLNRKEIYYEKISVMSQEANGEQYAELMEKIEDIDKEVERFKNLSKEEMLAMADLDKVDWMKISKTVLNNLRDPTECELYWRNIINPAINRLEFSKIEKENLLKLAENYGQKNWSEIAKELGTNRTPFQCFQFYQQNLNEALNKREWTENEDQALVEVVESCKIGKTISWNNVAYYIEGRSSTQCSIRWAQINPDIKHGKWTGEEDMKLLSSIYIHGEKWDQVAKSVPGRSLLQCRERYKSALDPSLRSPSEWTYEEDRKLLELADQCRKSDGKIGWSRVAEKMVGRTDNNVLFRHRKLVQWKEKCEWLEKQDATSKEELGYIDIEKLATGDSKRKKVKQRKDPSDEISQQVSKQKQNEEDYSRLTKELKKLPTCEYKMDYVKQLKDMREGKRVVPRPPLMYRTTRKALHNIWAKKKHMKYLIEKHLSQLKITNAEDRALIPEKTAEQFSPFSVLNPRQMEKVKHMLQHKLPSEISVKEMIAVSEKNKRNYTTVAKKNAYKEKYSTEHEKKIREILQYKYCYISRFRKPSGRPKKFYIFYPNGRRPLYFDAENPVQLSTVTSTLLFNALEVDGKKVMEAYSQLPKRKKTQLRSLYALLCRCFPHLASSVPMVTGACSAGVSGTRPIGKSTNVPSAGASGTPSMPTTDNEEGRKSWMVPVDQLKRKRGRKTKAELIQEENSKRPDSEMNEIVNSIVQKTRKQVSGQGKESQVTSTSKPSQSYQNKDLQEIDTPGTSTLIIPSTAASTGKPVDSGQNKNSAEAKNNETPSRRKRKLTESSPIEIVQEKAPKCSASYSQLSISEAQTVESDKGDNEVGVKRGRRQKTLQGEKMVESMQKHKTDGEMSNLGENIIRKSIKDKACNEGQAAMADLYTSEKEKCSHGQKRKSITLSESDAAEIAKAKLVRSIAAKRNSTESNNTGSSQAKVMKTVDSTAKQPLSLPISPPCKNLPTIVPLSAKNPSDGPVPTALVVNAGAAKVKPGQKIVQIARTNLTGANLLKPGQEPQQNSPKVIVLKQVPGVQAPNKFPILPPCVTTLRGYEELLIQNNILKSRAAECYNPYFYCEKETILKNRVEPVLKARNITTKLNMDTKLDRTEEIDAKRVNSFLDTKHPRNYGPYHLSTHPRKDLLKEYRDTNEFIKLKKRFDALFMWPAFLSLLQPESENFFDKQTANESLVPFDESMVDPENVNITQKERAGQEEKKQVEKKSDARGNFMGKYRIRHLQKKKLLSEKRRVAKQMQVKAIAEKGLERIRAEKKAKAEKIKTKQVQKWGSLVGSRASGRISDRADTVKEETVCGVAKSNLKMKSLKVLDRVMQYKKKGSCNIRQAVARASMKTRSQKQPTKSDDSELEDTNKCMGEDDFKDMKPFPLLKRRKSATMTANTDPIMSQLHPPALPPGYVMVPVMIPSGNNIPSSTTSASSSNSLPQEFLQSLMLMPQISPGSTPSNEGGIQPYPVLMLARGDGSNPLPVLSLKGSGLQLPVPTSTGSATAPLIPLSIGGKRQPPMISIVPLTNIASTEASQSSPSNTIAVSPVSVAATVTNTNIGSQLSSTPSTSIKKDIMSPISPATASIITFLGNEKASSTTSAATNVSPSTSGNPTVLPVAVSENSPPLSLKANSSIYQDSRQDETVSFNETLPLQVQNIASTSTSASSQIHETANQISSSPTVSVDHPSINSVSGADNSSVPTTISSNNEESDSSHVFVGSVPGQTNSPMLISVPKDSNLTVKELIQMMGNKMNKGDNSNQEPSQNAD